MSLSLEKTTKCFGGQVRQYKHDSSCTNTPMNFHVFVPSVASKDKKVPLLMWLSGLTCNDTNFITKAGAQRAAEKHHLALVCPDTSPRGAKIEGEDDSYDFGSGAGFYVDATEEKWSKHYNMYSYVTEELPKLLGEIEELDTSRCGMFGHSMGGHGALICALKNPGRYSSVSAFSPIAHPMECPWGKKAFSGYLGEDKSKWEEYDATCLVEKYSGPKLSVLIDQGTEDNFLKEGQLQPEAFDKAAGGSESIAHQVRMQDGYDHSYYFIATFIDDHIAFHAQHI